ncbi:unnamed protein product [Notodromas monacha]|uniref:S-methyl-5-thioribose-1-phosphate isomerase n=1 Tax=Notodromas monacha TaxID=399045 RepID=A0A7R9BDS2_9CRUS|nr:unnamed protein product [Notodromas monacha]CAG0913526.1 unnamed protein product [Notodromas monacha]
MVSLTTGNYLNIEEKFQFILAHFLGWYPIRARRFIISVVFYRQTPTFSPQKWNIHQAVLNDLGATNNFSEAWNRYFNGLVGKKNPTIWLLIRCLKQDAASVARTLKKFDEDGAIPHKQVRGAPAIAIIGCLAVASLLERRVACFEAKEALRDWLLEKFAYIVSSRPTAVNLKNAAQDLSELADKLTADNAHDVEQMSKKIVECIIKMMKNDVDDNMNIGRHGAEFMVSMKEDVKPLRVLTHCNTGSLATCGYGTALGVIRRLHEMKMLEHAYCTETRPYNQGARLTAYELVHDELPATLICDSMAGALMKSGKVDFVVTGADRLAVLAKYHNIPFFIAAPTTSVDYSLPYGSGIKIEDRPADELTCIFGQRIAAPGIGVWNPAFDVTPAALITGGIITEKGVFPAAELPN